MFASNKVEKFSRKSAKQNNKENVYRSEREKKHDRSNSQSKRNWMEEVV